MQNMFTIKLKLSKYQNGITKANRIKNISILNNFYFVDKYL